MAGKPKRTVYHVSPHPDGGWKVQKEKAPRAIARHDKKNDAVARAKSTAQKNIPSQVIVHKADGEIQTEFTYGDDPKKKKG